VQNEIYGSQSLSYRGSFLLRQKQYAEAAADFRRSLELAVDPYDSLKGLATALSGQGEWREALETTEELCRLRGKRCEYDIVDISTPFWEEERFYPAGIRYYQSLEETLPGRWWIHRNIAGLAERLGRNDLAAESRRRAEELKE
jgi:tetratricopeptide (TPR) repeat protein